MLHSISVVECMDFDDRRPVLKITVPETKGSTDIISHSSPEIASLCIPENGTHFRNDEIHLRLVARQPTVNNRESLRFLNGYALYNNFNIDSNSKQGNDVRKIFSILITTSSNDLKQYQTVLNQASLMYYTEKRRSVGLYSSISYCRKIILALYIAIQVALERNYSLYASLEENKKPDEFTLRTCDSFIQTIKTQSMSLASYANLESFEYSCSSLLSIVKLLRHEAIHLWYALIRNQRILVTGNASSSISDCCKLVLSIPLIVGSELAEVLMKNVYYVSPYVDLSNMNCIMKRPYIAGTTNQIFKTQSWFDINIDIASHSITYSNANNKSANILSPKEQCFINQVVDAIDKGTKSEAQLRQDFTRFTSDFLTQVATYSASRKRLVTTNYFLEKFLLSPMWLKYRFSTLQNICGSSQSPNLFARKAPPPPPKTRRRRRRKGLPPLPPKQEKDSSQVAAVTTTLAA